MHGLRKSKKWVMFLGENRLHKNQAGRKLSMHLTKYKESNMVTSQKSCGIKFLKMVIGNS